jgi:hypothetical protein
MPPHMIQELGRATWGNLQSEMVSFEKFTIGPWLRRIEGAIERDVLPEDGDLYAEFLVEGLLRGDITTRYQAYEVAIRNGWLTPEEVRMKENLGPLLGAEDDSPGEVEDTPGDAVEDVAEEDSGTSEDAPIETMQNGGTVSVEDDPLAAAANGAALADTALNGAQVTALLEVLAKVSAGLLDKQSAVAVIVAAFPAISHDEAMKIVAGVKLSQQNTVEPDNGT